MDYSFDKLFDRKDSWGLNGIEFRPTIWFLKSFYHVGSGYGYANPQPILDSLQQVLDSRILA